MISIIYPYRNRDLQRIKYSLESLKGQTSKAFSVYFVDYGSEPSHSKKVQNLLYDYTFVNYSYLYTELQPWNKSKALNSVIKKFQTGYFFVADIDLIFHPSFIEKALQLAKTKMCWYFQVGLLDEIESKHFKPFETYKPKFISDNRSTGLTLCPVEHAQTIRGFDEFYHFWGSEDTDFHERLKHAGYKVNFFNEELLLLHQWHKIYRHKETDKLAKTFQISGIVQYNQYYLQQTIKSKIAQVNNKDWGETQLKKQHEALVSFSKSYSTVLSCDKNEVDYFLFKELPHLKKGLHCFKIEEKKEEQSLKKSIKRFVKNKRVKQYLLKEVNDKLLFHIINFYRDFPYNYSISEDLKSITFVINKL